MAVRSALDQEIDSGVGVVIVNDGCPLEGTHRIAQTLRDAHPDRIAYLRLPNQGLSAARNAGIRRAFARWPHLEAIFPLDADNMLSPRTLAELWTILRAQPEASWASPALELFGAEEGEWRMPEPYLAYRQLFTNQSDAGSLIRRSVFEAGIEFDETMREGFEDWEFFLRATLAGFRGAQAGSCGFRYRRRPNSMLAQALPQAEKIEAEMRHRHRSAYRPGALARREHAEAPRFALVRCLRPPPAPAGAERAPPPQT
jgi:glycosyltransferase involved in cell wall biosynthesis